ncbi:M56 family metallopeptidase [uncultured Kocuria sp.]|uniref:M56 family metallopeptidase n=1 Tax=uncultured Kocuria sp. TaxID=259305 RepID=UPI002619BBB7|nr:M56 family metallopeptidase [uncultured Kocuria sp.]
MTAPLLLVSFAVLAAVAGPLLRLGTWADRSPRLAIFAWQAVSVSAVLSVILAGVSLAMPVMPTTTGVADFLQACAIVLRQQYSTPGGAALSTAGATLAILVLGRVLYCLVAELVSARRDRLKQLGSLSLISRRDPATGMLVVDHDVPAAYCLPGRRSEIVFTTAALGALDAEQRDAVLRHEQAHLRGQHHVVLGAADALVRAFPKVSLFVVARAEMGRLVELIADDKAAAGENNRLAVATALVRLAEAGSAPASALAASGTATVVRVRRLAAPAAPLRRVRVALTVAAATTVLALPLGVAATPAMATAQAQMCPLELPEIS